MGSKTVRVYGRADLQPRVTSSDAIGQHVQVHVPLPLDIGPHVTLSFQDALVEIRGPWMLPVPSAPSEQP